MTTSTQTLDRGTATWELDAAHSSVEFAVRHLMISRVRGRFSDLSGGIAWAEDEASSATVDVEISAASIDTGVQERDEHLRSSDFLDAERFPSLTFRSTKIERAGENELRVTGDLTIRDVTREVVLEVEERGEASDPWGGERAGFAATARIDRSDFGLTWNQALEAGGVLVGDEVKISIEAQLVRQT